MEMRLTRERQVSLEKLASTEMLQDNVYFQRITLVCRKVYLAECGPTKVAHHFSILLK